jgi:DNA-binding NarL/FixJ family response regulator
MAEDAGERIWNVLVVDDEADLLTLVRLTLEFESSLSVVATAQDAGEAILLADSLQPEVVVLDQMLGGAVTGLQVADQLRAAHPDVRVILFSAAADVIDLREHRVDAVVSKMDVADLPSVIRRVVGSASGSSSA